MFKLFIIWSFLIFILKMFSACATLVESDTWAACKRCCEKLKPPKHLEIGMLGDASCTCESGHVCDLDNMREEEEANNFEDMPDNIQDEISKKRRRH